MKKRISILVLFAVAALLAAVPAFAGQITFNGNITATQVGGSGGFPTPAVGLQFTNLTDADSGDALFGTAINFAATNSAGFVFDKLSGGSGLFDSSADSGTVSLGNATTGTLSGNIDFIQITSDGKGSFVLDVTLSGLSITTGTSALLDSFAGSKGGLGLLTFQWIFNNGPQSLSDLLNISGANRTSVSGAIAVPEPATLALLGAGLLVLGAFLRRRLVPTTPELLT